MGLSLIRWLERCRVAKLTEIFAHGLESFQVLLVLERTDEDRIALFRLEGEVLALVDRDEMNPRRRYVANEDQVLHVTNAYERIGFGSETISARNNRREGLVCCRVRTGTNFRSSFVEELGLALRAGQQEEDDETVKGLHSRGFFRCGVSNLTVSSP